MLKYIFATLSLISSFLLFSQSDNTLVVDDIFLDGNKVTKDYIIFRELMFAPGDTLPSGEISRLVKESIDNLKNLSIFNFQEIQMLKTREGHISFLVQVTEQWYIFPSPYFQLADKNVNSWLGRDDKWHRLNYGAWLYWKNFRGRAETLNFLFKTGYDQHYELDYEKPYINKAKTLGINIGVAYLRSHQLNANTVDNKEVFYPAIPRKEEYAKRERLAFAEVVYRKNIHTRHYFSIRYDRFEFSDSVLLLNPLFSFAGKTANRFLGFSYLLKYDFRDYIHYPLEGYYIDARISKRGLGIFMPWRKGNMEISGNARKFISLNRRFFLAGGVYFRHSLWQNTPYFLSPELGNMFHLVRGYEDFTIRGQSYALYKMNLKYNLLKPVTYRFKGIREEFGKTHLALYINLFGDAGYMKNSFNPRLNSLGDRLLIGGGMGLDIVTYYDKVLRIEFSYHKDGYWGVYIHYIPSI